MVDLGIDGFVEMVEERLGRRAATALIFVIWVGVFVWVANGLITLLSPVVAFALQTWPAIQKSPLFHWVPDVSKEPGLSLNYLLSVVLALVIYAAIGRRLYSNWTRKFDRRVDDARDGMLDLWGHIESTYEALRSSISEAKKRGVQIDDLAPMPTSIREKIASINLREDAGLKRQRRKGTGRRKRR